MSTTNLTVFVILMFVQTCYIGAVIDTTELNTANMTFVTEEPVTSMPSVTDNNAQTTGTTLDLSNTTTSSPPGPNLPLILGLSLGLGVPATLAVIGSVVYYLKIYRPKHNQIVIQAH